MLFPDSRIPLFSHAQRCVVSPHLYLPLLGPQPGHGALPAPVTYLLELTLRFLFFSDPQTPIILPFLFSPARQWAQSPPENKMLQKRGKNFLFSISREARALVTTDLGGPTPRASLTVSLKRVRSRDWPAMSH